MFFAATLTGVTTTIDPSTAIKGLRRIIDESFGRRGKWALRPRLTPEDCGALRNNTEIKPVVRQNDIAGEELKNQ